MTASAAGASQQPDAATDATTPDDAGPVIDVGVVIAYTPGTEPKPLRRFAHRAVEDAETELETMTGVPWQFHVEEPFRLSNDETRRPSDFLDEASLRMVEGPYDLVVVVTDATLTSRRREPVPGLASEVSRIAVVSTRRLTRTSRGRPRRELSDEAVRWNAATLVVHLLGHVLGADHADGVMAPFRFDESRRSVPSFGERTASRLRRRADRLPGQEEVVCGAAKRFVFHVRAALAHPRQVLVPLARNRAPLLPLSLPKLATAAVTPTLVLIFSAETWDVGVHMTTATAGGFALVSVLAATVYLTAIQRLFFPRKEKRILTEHMAVVNVAVFLTVLAAVVGLFVMVGLLMLGIELFIFPQDLITNWPTLEDPAVEFVDLVHTSAFVSTVGVLTGSLAGGLESRTVVRHLALFSDRP
jgi:predicted Zn-dependent protease